MLAVNEFRRLFDAQSVVTDYTVATLLAPATAAPKTPIPNCRTNIAAVKINDRDLRLQY